MRQAVILAGGKAVRLRSCLGDRPKALVDINGVPLLGRQLATLRSNGITDVAILVNHGAEQIESFCAGPDFADLHITLLHDGSARGTAGALLGAIPKLARRFIVIYGDTLFAIDLERFWRSHSATRADATLFVHPNDHPWDSDLVEIDEAGYIVALHRPPHREDAFLPNLVSGAMYMIEREAIASWQHEASPWDIARDLFPAMLRRGALMRGYLSCEYIKDIGTPERLRKAVSDLRTGMIERARRNWPQKAVFLDRDGTINKLRGHLACAENFELITGVAEAIRSLNAAECRVIVVTNQPTVARGETTFAGVREIHNKMQTLLAREGAFVDAIYLCPHHPDKGFVGEVTALKIACDCRKPGTALVDKACDDFNIDREQSWFIGDSTTDILTARNAGLKSILVETGQGGRDGKYPVLPDFIAEDLLAAVTLSLDSLATGSAFESEPHSP